VNSDADEFWWPSSGDLPGALRSVPPGIGVLVAHRDDFVPTTADEPVFYRRMTYRKARSTNALGRPLPPKVAHRATPDVSVAQGNHAVTGTGLERSLDDGRLGILHFPLRSYRQFERKIVAGGRAYGRNQDLPGHVGSTWRRLYALWEAGGLESHYASEEYDAIRLAEAVESGDIVPDRRLRDWFDSRAS
jgi:hypothetical protein